ncbi:MAG: hypothetical protein CM1200mP24_09830 [Gammaproteobacteria bacterium]|nr:MAG: hypothetical protein CM1200mP24_09830 [Gammaproteobacteria bacterium]
MERPLRNFQVPWAMFVDWRFKIERLLKSFENGQIFSRNLRLETLRYLIDGGSRKA